MASGTFETDQGDRIAVLASGGLDSSVMLAELSQDYAEVYPLYISCGLHWEETEQVFLREFLTRLGNPVIRGSVSLSFPTSDVVGEAWYAGGDGIPGYHEPDENWEIPGRNIVLLAKAALWAKLNRVGNLALGVLASNPFPDATPEFFETNQRALSLGLNQELLIRTPLARLNKAEVIRMGQQLPLEWTLSCADPKGRKHCGICGKCRERIEAFEAAGVADPTPYEQRIGTG